ncbi:hypothetical protein WH47_00123 [Habropoda laboriosa]|uniref:Uncharacterized protein n=1 Tax=Habropoda laboriosa TaxID=597456 RepID=A0A0L7R8U7_9HYME|nr:hypothetical protein WH47_00123 [Habropoda laboriosa]
MQNIRICFPGNLRHIETCVNQILAFVAVSIAPGKGSTFVVYSPSSSEGCSRAFRYLALESQDISITAIPRLDSPKRVTYARQ